ncbi:MAG: PASTA domain-containing protein [Oscillospiraceae bacterium]|jgi:hypothetical protein
MRIITCKKCGASIDIEAAGGECPYCGAIYYILPEDGSDDLSSTKRWTIPESQGGAHVRKPSRDPDDTQVWQQDDPDATRVWRQNDPDATRVWRQNDPDATQVWKPENISDAGKAAKPSPPSRNKRPVCPPAAGDRSGSARPPAKRPAEKPSFSEKEGHSYRERTGGMSSRTRAFIVGAVALLAVLVVVLSLMGGMLDFNKKKDTLLTMPNTVGMDKDSAVSLLEGMGLNVELSTQPSDKDEGIVIRQSAKEGKKVKAGDTVMLIVSSGPAIKEEEKEEHPVTVPSLAGSTYEKAKQDLEALGLRIIKFTDEYSDTYSEGTIISQDPVAGTQLSPGEYVKVTLSKGPEPEPEYIISVTAGKGGSISPKGRVSVKEGGSVTFTIIPDEGYEIREIKVDGQSVEAVDSYTFSDVRSDHSIYAIFRAVQSTPEPSPSPTPEPTPEVTDNGNEPDPGN